MTISLTWHDMLTDGKQQPYPLNTLRTATEGRQSEITIYSPQKDTFNAFHSIELGGVKVVILGQDFYYSSGQTHGLTSSAYPGVAISPSPLNMYKELEATIPGFTRLTHGYLESWAHWGVLLPNTVLIIRAGQAYSHASFSQETFTDKVIALINEHYERIVFLLWGSHVRKKDAIIDRQYRCVLKVPHLSPLPAYRGFFGNNRFVQTNQWLADRSEASVDWMPIPPAESE